MRLRPAVRALVVNEQEEVLLVHFNLGTADFWATPGGGIEPGEDERAALARELLEEVGLGDPDVVGVVWEREHIFPMKHWDGQQERIYLVRTRHFEPSPVMTTEELLAEGVIELRWWSLDAMRKSGVEFAPARLPDLVETLLRDGPPAAPLRIGR